MSSAQNRRVQRRRVFYIPGYDPVGPWKYRELYRREAAKQAAISGYAIDVSGRAGDDGQYGWTVLAEIEGCHVETRIEVLVWSDIVQDSMAGSLVSSYANMLRTVGIYIGSGAFARLIRLRPGPAIAAVYPVVLLVVYAFVALAVGGLLGGLTGKLTGVAWLSWIAGLGCAYGGLLLCRRMDRRVFGFYLMHLFAYCASQRGALPKGLGERIVAFRGRVDAALRSDADEVLVIGHSLGAPLAVTLVAGIDHARLAPREPPLGLVTLGQVVPMMSFLPDAWQLRRDLQTLSASQAVTWVDVSAPGDGCCFALCDPVAVSGAALPGKRWPLVLSAAFSQTLSGEVQRDLRFRYHRLHFQYLCAFDRPGDYDYFQLTAGPLTLAARHEGRAASRSRIEDVMSPFTSVSP